MGNITRDPELRYIPSGAAVATFTVAVNRVFATPQGDKKEEVSFIKTVVWGKMAEVCGKYLSKGSPVFVEGRLRTRTWQGTDGQNRNATEVVASNVQFLRGAPSKTQDHGMPDGSDTQDAQDEQFKGPTADINENGGNTDEIPF